jgi:hypothetical protein
MLAMLPPMLVAACGAIGSPPPAASPSVSVVEPARPVRVPELPGGVQLVGLHSGDLETLLGRPTLVRSEQQAQYWRYNLGGCQLDLFLYTDAKAGLARVVYLDVRPSGYASLASVDACAEVARRLRGEATAHADAAEPGTGSLPPVEAH